MMNHQQRAVTRCLLVLALVSLVAACAPELQRDGPAWPELKQEIREKFPAVSQLSVEQLAQRLESGAPTLLVDVRPEHEFAVSHLEGAVNAQGPDLVALLEQRQGSDELVVLYCSVGYRSSSEAAQLAKKGIKGVANLEGSIFEWANSGRRVMRSGGEVEEVHPYDDTWGLLLEEDLRSYGEPSGSP